MTPTAAPGVSPAGAAILARATARAPAARFASADEMAAALGRWLSTAAAPPVHGQLPAPAPPPAPPLVATPPAAPPAAPGRRPGCALVAFKTALGGALVLLGAMTVFVFVIASFVATPVPYFDHLGAPKALVGRAGPVKVRRGRVRPYGPAG